MSRFSSPRPQKKSPRPSSQPRTKSKSKLSPVAEQKDLAHSTAPTPSPPTHFIQVRGVHQNNLKGFNLDIPLYQLNVVTGPSGSGKSSLAFDTIYAEGQRRYVETFSPYTRQFFERMDKPKVEAIHGIPPAIAIEQVNNIRSTRSTVGTITELNDYLKMLFPRLAKARCPSCNRPVQPDTPESIQQDLLIHHASTTALITFQIPVPKDTNTADFFAFLQSQGYTRVLLFGDIIRTDEPDRFKKKLPGQVAVIQDRILLDPKNQPRLIEALETALNFGKGSVSVTCLDVNSDKGVQGKISKSYSTDWRCADCDLKLPPPTPGLFSFNNPVGACPTCRGFGKTLALDLTKAMPDETLSIKQGLVKAFSGDTYAECQDDLIRCAKIRGIDLDLPFEDFTPEDRQWLIEGDRSDPEEAYQQGEWYGVRGFFKWQESRAYKMHVRVFLSRYRAYTECPDCLGSRLKIEASFYRLNDKTLHDLWQLPVGELLPFFQDLDLPESDKAARILREEIVSRLSYMERAGLSYLNLDRQTRTLSGGELQRVNLTTCLGASLVNTLFVLDEPSIGLHPRDIGKLISVMQGLRDKGNTLLVVEHEESVMRAADNLIEIGPGRGENGGELVFHGPLKNLSIKTGTLTGDYLFGRKTIPIPSKRRKPKATQQLRIVGARHNNLKKLNVEIPLHLFVAITGVSGSGKSTLIHDVLYNHMQRQRGVAIESEPGKVKSISGTEKVGQVIMVDQSPLARTPRSTPAVYIGAFDQIRQLFADTPQAKHDQLTPGFFSFNSGNGRCERCMGNGFEKIEMQFLSDLYVSCPECEGKRYQNHALKYTLNGKNIHDILNLTIEDAITFFSDIKNKKADNLLVPLTLLKEAGLSYLRLGQPLNTLSGGEAQRLKLIGHLLEPSPQDPERKTLFLLDEPTTGLHFDDIALLVKLLQRLVNEGHSLIVIEHNLEIIKCADWIIDLGPEAGTDGGELVAAGPPELIAKNAKSWTGQYLSAIVHPDSTVNESAQPYLPVTVNRTIDSASGSSMALVPTIPQAISVRGAREHNLKNLNLDIPRDQLVVVTGLSGSGKSSLAFDLIFAEGQRRFLDSMSVYARTFVEQMEKPDVDLIVGVPPTVAIEQRVSRGSGKSTVATVTEIYHFLRLLYSKVGIQHCPNCHIPVQKQSIQSIVQLTAQHAKKSSLDLLSPLIKARKGFHTDVAEAAAKQGIETLLVDGEFKASANFKKLARFKEHTIDALITSIAKNASEEVIRPHIERALKLGKGIIKLLLPDQSQLVLNTDMSCPQCSMSFEELDPRLFSFNSPHGWCPDCRGFGVITSHPGSDQRRDDISLLEAELEEERKFDSSEHTSEPCPSCDGSRLNPIARAVKVQNIPIADITKLSAERAAGKISLLTFTGSQETITRDIMVEIQQRLHFMQQVGLGYLQLGRSADTLSGGEAQRIRLASQLGSNLRGVLYVLDEPTIGLHPRDNQRLLQTLLALRDKGNSLLVVEHDEETMRNADTILDLGPGAGRYGGELIAQGNLTQILNHPNSTTGQALREPMKHPLHGKRRALPKKNDAKSWLTLKNANQNNLKNVTLNVPLGRLTVITGVSGSGKSTLMRSALYPAVKSALSKSSKNNPQLQGAQHLAAVYEVDQSPIGKTSRSCPATYVGVLDDIRKLFAQLPTARARGFGPGRFSFNTEGGRCETCQGNGEIKVEMNFLPSTRVHCDTCHGLRFNAATLEVTYNGKNIGEVLKMSITEAAEFFVSLPKIARPLQLLADTGVGYLQLGQPSPTLSGGESQRLKLVTELQAGQGRTISDKMRGLKTTKRNLYLIEEPTIGLHAHDVAKLIDILHRLVDEGHTVVVIEHEINVIAEADHLIDIGPEAGEYGGKIIAEGSPEKVALSKISHTAPFLRELFSMADS